MSQKYIFGALHTYAHYIYNFFFANLYRHFMCKPTHTEQFIFRIKKSRSLDRVPAVAHRLGWKKQEEVLDCLIERLEIKIKPWHTFLRTMCKCVRFFIVAKTDARILISVLLLPSSRSEALVKYFDLTFASICSVVCFFFYNRFDIAFVIKKKIFNIMPLSKILPLHVIYSRLLKKMKLFL